MATGPRDLGSGRWHRSGVSVDGNDTSLGRRTAADSLNFDEIAASEHDDGYPSEVMVANEASAVVADCRRLSGPVDMCVVDRHGAGAVAEDRHDRGDGDLWLTGEHDGREVSGQVGAEVGDAEPVEQGLPVVVVVVLVYGVAVGLQEQ